MEDYGWLLFLAVFWIFSMIGEARKKRRKQRRQRRPETDETEEIVRTGPLAGERDLARDVQAGATRAAEALRRWEARQKQPADRTAEELPVRLRRGETAAQRRLERERVRRSRDPEVIRRRREREVARRRGPAETVGRRHAREDRREAYEAIAGMLAGRAEEAGPVEVGDYEVGVREIGGGADVQVRQREDALPAVPTVTADAPTGLARIERLPMLQRAVILGELVGPPRAIKPVPDLF